MSLHSKPVCVLFLSWICEEVTSILDKKKDISSFIQCKTQQSDSSSSQQVLEKSVSLNIEFIYI